MQNLDRASKEEHKWIPDRYLGWRSHDNLETVTGSNPSSLHLMFLSVGTKGNNDVIRQYVNIEESDIASSHLLFVPVCIKM